MKRKKASQKAGPSRESSLKSKENGDEQVVSQLEYILFHSCCYYRLKSQQKPSLISLHVPKIIPLAANESLFQKVTET